MALGNYKAGVFDGTNRPPPIDVPDELPAEVVQGKSPLSGPATVALCILGAAGMALGFGLAMPWIAAVGAAIVVASVLAYATGNLAEYAVVRPLRRAGNALAAIGTAARKASQGDFAGAGRTLAAVEWLDWLALLALLLALALLFRWGMSRWSRSRR